MRICDVMLSFPSILIALLIDGVGRALFPNAHDTLAFGVLILAIALPGWVQYARTVRGSTHGRAQQGIRAGGARHRRAAAAHHAASTCCPTCSGPVLVLATIQVATAIITEATLSFLGVGVPPTSPSLGTLINERQRASCSRGEWWIVDLSGRDAGADRAQHQPVRRLAARRAEPAAALTVASCGPGLASRSRSCRSPASCMPPPSLAVAALLPRVRAPTITTRSSTGARYYQTPIDTYPVSILSRVDGSASTVTVRNRPALRVGSRARAGHRAGAARRRPAASARRATITLDVAPCTRYYLVAVKTNRLASDFTVRVDYQEPVSGCTPA